MSFANLYFIFLFLPVVTILYYWFKKYRLFILIISSQLFYFYEGLDALVFLNLAILISYYAKKNIKLSLIFLFSTLFFFKYSFHLSTLFDFKILNFFSLKIDLKNTTVFAGLSFYTFQLAGYLLEKKKDLSLKELFLFTSFFPQIVAGPIIKKKLFVDNLKNMEKGGGEDKKNGYRQLFFVEYLPKFLLFFSYGLFYKIVCADILSIFSENYSTYIEQASTNNDNINIYIFIFYAFAYGFRIYFDFAGYSLMAIGIGYLFNFKLPKNFDEPYKKLSIKDFWRHWHITLSMWFRDHIFNFIKKKYSFIFAILVTFLLSGIWHGAGWGFVYWGLYHGILYLIYNYFEKRITQWNYYIKLFLLNILVMLSWPFFDLGFDLYVYSIFNLELNFSSFYFPINKYFSYLFITFIFLIVYFFDEKKVIYKETIISKKNYFSLMLSSPYIIASLFVLSISLIEISKTFIYFRF